MKYLSFEKTVFILSLVILIITCINCGDSGTSANENSGFCIRGRISNWTLGEKTLHAYVIGSTGGDLSVANCPVQADGSFNLCLPSNIADSLLYPKESIFYSGCSGGNISYTPPDVKGIGLNAFIIKSGDSNIGYLKCNNYEILYPGAYYLQYTWANKKVTIVGNVICAADTLVFDGAAVSGWNKVSVVYNRVSTTSGATILYKFSEPGGAEWKYFSY